LTLTLSNSEQVVFLTLKIAPRLNFPRTDTRVAIESPEERISPSAYSCCVSLFNLFFLLNDLTSSMLCRDLSSKRLCRNSRSFSAPSDNACTSSRLSSTWATAPGRSYVAVLHKRTVHRKNVNAFNKQTWRSRILFLKKHCVVTVCWRIAVEWCELNAGHSSKNSALECKAGVKLTTWTQGTTSVESIIAKRNRAHFQVRGLHNVDKQGVCRRIFNRKSISRKITHPQSVRLPLL